MPSHIFINSLEHGIDTHPCLKTVSAHPPTPSHALTPPTPHPHPPGSRESKGNLYFCFWEANIHRKGALKQWPPWKDLEIHWSIWSRELSLKLILTPLEPVHSIMCSTNTKINTSVRCTILAQEIDWEKERQKEKETKKKDVKRILMSIS